MSKKRRWLAKQKKKNQQKEKYMLWFWNMPRAAYIADNVDCIECTKNAIDKKKDCEKKLYNYGAYSEDTSCLRMVRYRKKQKEYRERKANEK